ncbi:MAG: hypothetical protein IIC73_03480 [Armatimonadetes bacterium]|nr:hypothetical protein [Armatimonadota bacterium]
MARRSRITQGLRLLLVPVVAMALCGFSGESGRDRRIQSRLYDHLDRAERAFSDGRNEEATACAEMVLLKRDITVFVDDRNVPWQIKESAHRALRLAAINWEDALNREIRFRYVPRAYADVVIRYTDGVKHGGREAAGTVQWCRQVMDLGSNTYSYKVTAHITLRTYAPNGAMMSQRQMLHTAGHELGHILGLEDTGKQGELMGPLRLDRPVQRASQKEVESLWDIRNRADLILRRITGQGVPGQVPGVELHGLVLSTPAKQIESQETHLRIARDRGRTAPVRRTLRDRKASARKKRFSVAGMAR